MLQYGKVREQRKRSVFSKLTDDRREVMLGYIKEIAWARA